MRRFGQLYLDGQQRILDLVAWAGDETAAQTAVPACPGWTVHDVLAHVTGVAADVLAGRMDGVTTPAWTAAQVAARRESAASDIAHEWKEVAPAFAAIVDDFPGWYGPQVVADITVHEQDLRGALELPGARDSEALQSSLDMLMSVVFHASANALGLGPIGVNAGGRSWLIGGVDVTEGTTPTAAIDAALLWGDKPRPSTAEPVVTLTADPFELFRAATGRRSATQIRAFDWSDDPTAYVRLFGQGPFTLRESDLAE